MTDTIGNGTRKLSACRAVPQPTAPPHKTWRNTKYANRTDYKLEEFECTRCLVYVEESKIQISLKSAGYQNVDWSHLASDIDSWLAVVMVSMNPRSIEGGNLALLHWQLLTTQSGKRIWLEFHYNFTKFRNRCYKLQYFTHTHTHKHTHTHTHTYIYLICWLCCLEPSKLIFYYALLEVMELMLETRLSSRHSSLHSSCIYFPV
jgi:hypothetical protein